MDEMWKDVVGYEGLYQVSSFGRVRTLKSSLGLADKSHPKDPDGILSAGLCKGYPQVVLADENGKRQTVKVHTLVLSAFVGPRPSGHEAGHLNAVRSDNRLHNLSWITRQANTDQRESDGHTAKGSRHGRAKLNENDVLEIRSLRGTLPTAQIAERFGVSKASISHIFSGRNWSHVK